ncbi:hypothetical protein GCM10009661_72480 [Catellatospora chokoriensis]|uniref:Uncharacterized protein n=1 Tax=Catellatospora chokoriensis TaxID=310353 RepID=A0A8J3NXY9_9ACTN|nr:hypothetical protein Cch02nite_82190 [Catellatospora chokoriensis]
MSSANSTPLNVLSPSASAAHSSARLVMLLEPGNRTVASGGCSTGDNAITDGKEVSGTAASMRPRQPRHRPLTTH